MSSSEPILEDFLTKEELAAELGRNMRTLDRWEALGIGPPRTLLGRKILYRRMSVQRWLAAQENQGRSGTAASERSRAREFRGAL
jgi:phage terminase Nu1 subunit (DNA packaging protein)